VSWHKGYTCPGPKRLSGFRCNAFLLNEHGEGRQCERCMAFDRGHAAGYAEAVADVVAWLASDKDVPHMSPSGIADCINDGAHVGAAKKGGGT
jgi:hypothetical protein